MQVLADRGNCCNNHSPLRKPLKEISSRMPGRVQLKHSPQNNSAATTGHDGKAALRRFCLNPPHIRALKPQNKNIIPINTVMPANKQQFPVACSIQNSRPPPPDGSGLPLTGTTLLWKAAGNRPGEEEEEQEAEAGKQHQDQGFPPADAKESPDTLQQDRDEHSAAISSPCSTSVALVAMPRRCHHIGAVSA